VRRGVILDRDGTLIEEVGYLDRLDRVHLFAYSIDAVRVLNRAGFAVTVATNQAGVARGYFNEAFVDDVHRCIASRFAAAGARIDGFYYCPHHPDGEVAAYRQDCDCRKPAAGMVRQAAADHQLDLTRSFVIGDRPGDVDTAATVGATGILVRTGYGYRHEQAVRDAGGRVFDNLMQAVSWILRQS
jgi:D-glycero-D-manno-heptose 1,7-bisphosphate phosphatase